MLSGRQCKAARSALDWTRAELAERSGVHERTLIDFERGARQPINATQSALKRALEDVGVIFEEERIIVPVPKG